MSRRRSLPPRLFLWGVAVLLIRAARGAGDVCQSEFVECAATAFDDALTGNHINDVSLAVMIADGPDFVLKPTLSAWRGILEEASMLVDEYVRECVSDYRACEDKMDAHGS